MIKQINTNEGLAKLTGSEKQIAWATSIRDEMIDMINRTPIEKVVCEEAYIQLNMTCYNLYAKNESKWWIESRFTQLDYTAKLCKMALGLIPHPVTWDKVSA